ncbi:hypothetical protein [Paenibacillus naphthalenovorans]|uniref:hypothetical protein n=1 Tax=Paenibacillus naphthalenovorans TaxID=162209 RepID=UPI003D2739F4
MTKAWEIARAGQKKFGGRVKEYFAESMRLAWAIIKKGANALKPSKETVFDLVRKTKAAALEYHNLEAQADKKGFKTHDDILKSEKAARKASELNKQLKSMLSLFTEEERNAMRNEFNQ